MRALRCLYVIAFISIVLLNPEAALSMPDFTERSVGGSDCSRPGVNFAIDPRGIPAMAYFKSDLKLYYRSFGNAAWSDEVAAAGVGTNGARNYAVLLFIYGQPHIVFYDASHMYLKHAWRTFGGVWSSEIVDNSPSTGTYVSAIPCDSGKICAAYYDQANTSIKFAKGSAGSWAVSTIDSNGNDLGQFPSLAVNANGRPMISYYDATQMRPKVAQQQQNETWAIETLPDIYDYYYDYYGRWTSLSQGGDGTIHLSCGSWSDAYLSNSDGSLYYARKPQGGEWSVEKLPPLFTSAHTSISVMADGNPQIAARRYRRSAVTGSDASVYYAYMDNDGNWNGTNITPDDNENFYSGITSMFDAWGSPMVAYSYAVIGLPPTFALHGPADNDGDWIPDLIDVFPNNPDADSDGIADGMEVLSFGTNRHAADTDGDGAADALDKDPLDSDISHLVRDGSADRPVILSWEAFGSPMSVSKVAEPVAQGTRSLGIDSPGSFGGVAQRNISTSPSTGYQLQLYYLRKSGTVKISLGWGADSDFEAAAFSDGVGNGWQLYRRHFTTPPEAGDLRLLVESNGEVYADAIQLYESSPEATPVPMPTLLPTSTQTFTPTITPVPSNTATPTATRTATVTATQAVATHTPAQPSPAPTSIPATGATPAPVNDTPSLTPTTAPSIKLKAATRSVRNNLSAVIIVGGLTGDVPAGRIAISLTCDKKQRGRAYSLNRRSVKFQVLKKAKRQSCYLWAMIAGSKITSNKIIVRSKT